MKEADSFLKERRRKMSQATLSSNKLNSLVSDAGLTASFGNVKVARKQYMVQFTGTDFHSTHTYHRLVWADNKVEANRLAREYAARILNRTFKSIIVL